MKYIPTFRQIKSREELQLFSIEYHNNSGLSIPGEYLVNEANRVFGIYLNKELIGGYVLGNDSNFRTIKYFCHEKNRPELNKKLDDLSLYTEICCFWIGPNYRTKFYINFLTWLSLTFVIRVYGTKYLLFGTCSKSLAKLYGQTEKSILIHQDRINNKSTFIFYGKKSTCVWGMFEIIKHKIIRNFKLTRRPYTLNGFERTT